MSYTPVNPYCALADLLQELKQPASFGVSNGDELLAAIDRASRWVDDYTSRTWYFVDNSVNPLIFDQFTDNVFQDTAFFPNVPMLNIDTVAIGDTTTGIDDEGNVTGNGIALVLNRDYYADDSKIYILPNAWQYIYVIDCPRDGAGRHYNLGWSLHRPERMLFMWGQFGYVQPLMFNCVAAGDAVPQTSEWQLGGVKANQVLYWEITAVTALSVTTYSVNVYSDVGRSNLVANGQTSTPGAQVLELESQSTDNIYGTVSINPSAQQLGGAGVTLTAAATGIIDRSQVPAGLPGKITIATRLVAAAFSGHNRQEFIGIDGRKETLINSEIPKTVYQLLGRRMPILV